MIKLSERWYLDRDPMNYILKENVTAAKTGTARLVGRGYFPSLKLVGGAIVDLELDEAAGVVEDLQELRTEAIAKMEQLFASIDYPLKGATDEPE